MALRYTKNRELEISSKYEDRWKSNLKISMMWLKNLVQSSEKSCVDRLKFDSLDINLVEQNFRHKVTKLASFF